MVKDLSWKSYADYMVILLMQTGLIRKFTKDSFDIHDKRQIEFVDTLRSVEYDHHPRQIGLEQCLSFLYPLFGGYAFSICYFLFEILYLYVAKLNT